MRQFQAFTTWGKKSMLVFVFVALAGATMPQPAAACHSVCTAVQPPDCLGCGFTAFRSYVCIRGGCNFCQEDYCTVEVPSSPAQQLACEPTETKSSQVKTLKIETLSPRS